MKFWYILELTAELGQFAWGGGATVARLTPDQKVGSSNLFRLISESFACHP